MKNSWFARMRSSSQRRTDTPGPPLIHVLDGFMNAGQAASLASQQLALNEIEVVHEFDLDTIFDYRASRPSITFETDHYVDYAKPRLAITRHRDDAGKEYLLLAGPEPDFGWEGFIADTIEVMEDEGVPLALGLGAIPMGVPHTRPTMITAHATRPELIDRKNLWEAQVRVPASAQTLLEYRLGQQGHDAAGYVVHVPHYLAQIEFPHAAVALLDAAKVRLGLSLDTSALEATLADTVREIEQHIAEQSGEDVLTGLEEQYDAFARGAAQSLLADAEKLPTGDELAAQLEAFLAQQRKNDS